jgi:signal transduction histidine kinase
MKAVQSSVLGGFGERRLGFRDPRDLFDIVASAFSRYPYVDSLFVWRVEPDSADGRLFVFNRADRPPMWAANSQRPSPFPVALIVDPRPIAPMMDALRAGNTQEQFVLTEIVAAGIHYQVVASLFFDRGTDQPLAGAVGFLVDLAWVRRHYFAELLKEVDTVIGEEGVNLSILDEHSTPVTSSGTPVAQGVAFERRFPLAFIDRSLLPVQSKVDSIPVWTIRVKSGVTGASAVQPWRALWWLMLLAAVTSLISVILMAQSVKTIAENAAARSDFVATVTHDLKSPLALVRAVGETLEFGRYPPDRRIDEYGRLLRLESTRLTLRIDNLLAFARASDARHTYRADTVDLLDVIHESLHRAEPRMADFELDENLADAPLVVGDPTALVQMFDNLIDNAIKYSAVTKHISIRTATEGARAVVAIQDRGTGIAPADRPRIFEKFFRGSTHRSGSGLGLAIVESVVRAHHGTIEVVSELGQGTTVTVKLPLGYTG